MERINNNNELVLPKRYNKNLMERQNKRERELNNRINNDWSLTNRPRLENPFITENIDDYKEINEIINILPTKSFKLDDKNNNSKCMICLSNYQFGNKISSLPCFHNFHLDCIKKWLYQQKWCPICKYNISLESLLSPICET